MSTNVRLRPSMSAYVLSCPVLSSPFWILWVYETSGHRRTWHHPLYSLKKTKIQKKKLQNLNSQSDKYLDLIHQMYCFISYLFWDLTIISSALFEDKIIKVNEPISYQHLLVLSWQWKDSGIWFIVTSVLII